jgi:DNA-binding CsgD family transcriptional regulator
MEVLKKIAEKQSMREAARSLRLHVSTVRDVVERVTNKAATFGYVPQHDLTQQTVKAKQTGAFAPQPPAPVVLEMDALRKLLGKGSFTPAEIAEQLKVTRGAVIDGLDTLLTQGVNVQEFSGKFTVQHMPAPKHAFDSKNLPTYASRPDGTYLFGFTSDNHLGSKYARLDVLNDLYDKFAEQGVDRVFNAGNWIDGEARFNMHDLLVHGMDAQVRYLVANYPQRKGITTYAVAGDDHEGWYCQSSGVDIGRYAERAMQDAGRKDWVDMGFMESFVRLVHADTGESTVLHLMHPGGGTAYAISYTVQKIVEGYDGGEKPAVLLAGHYHKMSYNMVRNVHAIQTGTTEDQTPFMRKKKIPAHVGGGICKLTQDPRTGAITSCRVEFFNYFVKDYYNNRWSHSGDVQHADRMEAA